MVQPRMAFGSLLLLMTLVTAACAERETARAGTEPSGTQTETADRDAPTTVFTNVEPPRDSQRQPGGLLSARA
jgi:hypothetical protein